MLKVKFFFDFDKDLNYIRKSFPQLRKICGKHFDSLLEFCYPDLTNKENKQILEYFKQNKKEIIERNEIAGEKLKQSWSKIADEFFAKVEKLTGFKWKNEIYYCHISSSFICGGYRKLNIVAVCPFVKELVTTLAHELIHLHVLDILDNLNLTLKDKKKLWSLYEILVSSIISKLNIKEIKHETEIGWSKLKPIYEKVRPLWKDDFKKFVLGCVKELNSLDNV